jgi:hypothetical protein
MFGFGKMIVKTNVSTPIITIGFRTDQRTPSDIFRYRIRKSLRTRFSKRYIVSPRHMKDLLYTVTLFGRGDPLSRRERGRDRLARVAVSVRIVERVVAAYAPQSSSSSDVASTKRDAGDADTLEICFCSDTLVWLN